MSRARRWAAWLFRRRLSSSPTYATTSAAAGPDPNSTGTSGSATPPRRLRGSAQSWRAALGLLIALAAGLAFWAPLADAQEPPTFTPGTIWSANLTVGQVSVAAVGFGDNVGTLSHKTFSYDGSDYTVNRVLNAGSILKIELVGNVPDQGGGFDDLVFEVDGTEFAFADAIFSIPSAGSAFEWRQDAPSWSLDDTVVLRIKRILKAPGKPTGLTAAHAGSGTDPRRTINLSWTAPTDDGGSAITGYRIEVSEDDMAWRDLVADTGNTDTSHADIYTRSLRRRNSRWQGIASKRVDCVIS